MGQNQARPEASKETDGVDAVKDPDATPVQDLSAAKDEDADDVVPELMRKSSKEKRGGEEDTEPVPTSAPAVKHQNLFEGDEKDVGVTVGTQGVDNGDKPDGPTKMQRLFRRRSSSKVCPDSLAVGENSPPSARGSPKENHNGQKGTGLMFSGTLSPVSNRDATSVEEGFISTTQLYNSLNDGQLSTYIFDPQFMLIVDTRMREDYHAQHIVTAVHISELEAAEQGKVEEALDTYTMIILYDCKGLSHSLKDTVLSMAATRLQDKGVEPFTLVGGFDAFQTQHPYLCTNRIPQTEAERQMLITNYPSIILEDQLYLGAGKQACKKKIVDDLKLTHIVNVGKEHGNRFVDTLDYYCLGLDDDSTTNLLREFSGCIEFIEGAVESGGRVLVHCNLGMSRSATVVIAYLMYTKRWTLQDADQFVRDRRPIIRPNRGFVNQLSRFEEMLYGKKLTSIEDYLHSGFSAE